MTRSLAHGLRPGEDETPTSYCSRVAFLNGRSARDFCRNIDLDFGRIAAGASEALSLLCNACDLDEGAFSTSALVVSSQGHFTLGGQSLGPQNLMRGSLRVCPACLSEDLHNGSGVREARAYARAIWQVKPIGVCFAHRQELQIIAASPRDRHDFAANVQEMLPSLSGLSSLSARPPTAFESYLRSRLRGEPNATRMWLDEMPLFAAVRACEMVGAAASSGRRFGTRDHRSDEVGFGILRDGPTGIRVTLAELAATFPSGKADWGPRSIFGRLYEWLAHETDAQHYEPLREVITAFCIETMPIGPGDRLFNKPVQERRNHSIRSASLATGIHPKRLRKLLEIAELIAPETSGLSDDRVVFPAARAQPFLKQMASTMSLAETERYLNAPRPHSRLLYEAGFITPVAVGGTEILKDHAFAKGDLDRFLFDLLGSTTSALRGSPGMMPINAAARRLRCSTMDIVRLVIDGQLDRLGRDDDSEGYMAVLVDIGEVTRALGHSSWITMSNLEAALSLPRESILALSAAGLLAIERRKNPYTQKTNLVALESDVDDFHRNYVLLRGLCARQSEAKSMRERLSAANIEPACSIGPISHTVYRRADVLPFIPKIYTY